MLKRTSLCLYSSNLGTFWLKIEQFWPFEEISIFSNGGYLGYRTRWRKQFWKGTTQGSFQQSLAEISWLVSEKKIILNFIPLFLFLAWWPSCMEVGITGHKFQGLPKDHSTKVWLQLAQWFLRRRLVCEFPIGSNVKLSPAVAAILNFISEQKTLRL